MNKPSYIDFDHEKFKNKLSTKYNFQSEVGVLSYNYSKKISKIWSFKDPDNAKISSNKIYDTYLALERKVYNQIQENVRPDYIIYNIIKADICRKFLLMGYTRSMRYFYHRTGRKWGQKTVNGKKSYYILPFDYDPAKKVSADIFKVKYNNIMASSNYLKMRQWYKKNITNIVFDAGRI